MAFSDIPVLGVLKYKMKWHQARQGVLAQNIANADTPRYQPRDLKRVNFSSLVAETSQQSIGLTPQKTNASHLSAVAIPIGENSAGFETAKSLDWEVTPDGNGVALEDQMMKVTENQMEYQAATTLYSRSLGLLRLAVGSN